MLTCEGQSLRLCFGILPKVFEQKPITTLLFRLIEKLILLTELESLFNLSITILIFIFSALSVQFWTKIATQPRKQVT